MAGVSKQGCVKLARYQNREMVRALKQRQWGMVLHCRLTRDSWIGEARAK